MAYQTALTFLFFIFSFVGCTTTTNSSLQVSQNQTPVFPPVVISGECGNFLVQFTFERTSQTAATYSVYITDLSGQPFANAARVILAFTPLDQENEDTVTLVAHPSAQRVGMYAPNNPYTPRPGLWKIETVVRREQPPDALCVFKTAL